MHSWAQLLPLYGHYFLLHDYRNPELLDRDVAHQPAEAGQDLLKGFLTTRMSCAGVWPRILAVSMFAQSSKTLRG